MLGAAARWKTPELLEMLLRNYDFAPRRLVLFSAAGSNFVFVGNISYTIANCILYTHTHTELWPARATTEISLAEPRHPLAVPVGWGLLREADLLPTATHYCTISHVKKTQKRIARSTLLPITKKCKKENKMSKTKHIKKQRRLHTEKTTKKPNINLFQGVGVGVASPGTRLRN
jgi:hypothetical protein